MATVIAIKTGSGVPPALAAKEIAADPTARKAYIGPAGGGAGIELDGGDLAVNARRAVTRQAVTTASATLAIDLALGWHVSLTLSHTITTLTVSNPPASGQLGKVTLDIASTGAFNIADWPGTTIWAGGVAPTVTSGSGKKDTIILTTVDAGTNWRGYLAGQDFA